MLALTFGIAALVPAPRAPRAGNPTAVAINKVDFCYGLPVRATKSRPKP